MKFAPLMALSTMAIAGIFCGPEARPAAFRTDKPQPRSSYPTTARVWNATFKRYDYVSNDCREHNAAVDKRAAVRQARKVKTRADRARRRALRQRRR